MSGETWHVLEGLEAPVTLNSGQLGRVTLIRVKTPGTVGVQTVLVLQVFETSVTLDPGGIPTLGVVLISHVASQVVRTTKSFSTKRTPLLLSIWKIISQLGHVIIKNWSYNIPPGGYFTKQTEIFTTAYIFQVSVYGTYRHEHVLSYGF